MILCFCQEVLGLVWTGFASRVHGFLVSRACARGDTDVDGDGEDADDEGDHDDDDNDRCKEGHAAHLQPMIDLLCSCSYSGIL